MSMRVNSLGCINNMAKMKLTKQHKEFHLWVMEKECCVPRCGNLSIFHHQNQAYPLPRRDHKWGVNICGFHHSQYHDKYGSDRAFYDAYDIWLPDFAAKNYEYWSDES